MTKIFILPLTINNFSNPNIKKGKLKNYIFKNLKILINSSLNE